MPVPEMYGVGHRFISKAGSLKIHTSFKGFNLRFEDDKLVIESFCRVVGGSGRTNHITAEGATLVEEGWG